MIVRNYLRGGRSLLTGTLSRFKNAFDPPVLVLIYHRVTALSSDPQLLAVSPENFRSQIEFLKANLPILRFEADWSAVREPSIVITFDDGYADNFLEALPILEETGVPATFFVSTGDLGTDREFWWDELERLILLERDLPPSFDLREDFFVRSWTTGNETERAAMYADMHPFMKQLSAEQRDRWLGRLRDWSGAGSAGRTSHRIMTIDEVKTLSDSAVATIGAHTVTHTPLSSLSVACQHREITLSKSRLEELTGRPITVFSYPFGGRCDYTKESVGLCRETGFVRVASNFPGQAHRWTDPYQIPRHLMRDWPLEEFVNRLRRCWVS